MAIALRTGQPPGPHLFRKQPPLQNHLVSRVIGVPSGGRESLAGPIGIGECHTKTVIGKPIPKILNERYLQHCSPAKFEVESAVQFVCRYREDPLEVSDQHGQPLADAIRAWGHWRNPVIAFVLVARDPLPDIRPLDPWADGCIRKQFAEEHVGHLLQLTLIRVHLRCSGPVVPVEIALLRENNREGMFLFLDFNDVNGLSQRSNTNTDLNHIRQNFTLMERPFGGRGRKHCCQLLLAAAEGVGRALIPANDSTFKEPLLWQGCGALGLLIEDPSISQMLQHFR